MSIGLENKMYPFLIADRNIWPINCKIVNSSLPGMTAADSAAFYFRHQIDLLEDLGAVLIYLGNCDTASTEVKKGKYSKISQIKNQFYENIGKIPSKTSIKNRLLHFEWNDSINPQIESPEHPDDYKYNIDRIIKNCKKRSVPVIIVRPKANLFFPSGIGKGNFVFYRYYGINDKISHQIKIPDTRFPKALKLHEAGKFDEAASVYREILIEPPITAMSQEYSLLVSNNYAVAKAESGQYKEAIYLLNILLHEQGVRKEIVLYNIAQIKKDIGESEEFLKFLNQSFEEDSSLYRVRSPYLLAIDQLVAKHSAVKLIDMDDLISDGMYLDWCHPLPEGQKILANNIAKAFKDFGIYGTNKVEIENFLYNPEVANGNVSKFHDYFKTFASFTEKQILDQIEELKEIFKGGKEYESSMPELDSISRELKTAIEYYFRHPIFTTIKDVLQFPPVYSSDIGRFPEYYLVRHLIPYLRIYESDKTFKENFNFELNLLRTNEKLLSILPEKSKSLVCITPPEIDIKYEYIRLPLVLSKVRNLLLNHLKMGNQVYNRTKTAIFWYVRESLRFGTHSRYSMRYDRLLLEFLAEGLAVAEVINKSLEMKKSTEIDELKKLLNQTVNVHEYYCEKFSFIVDSKQLLSDYDLKLNSLFLSFIAREN